MTNLQLLAPVQYGYSTFAPARIQGAGAIGAPTGSGISGGMTGKGFEGGVVLQFSPGGVQKSGNYAPDGRKVEDSKLLQMEKARMKEQNEPCKTCAERKYQDGSDDMGVSFKAPTSVSPGAAAGAVRSHEQEHVARAQSEGREKNMNVQSSVIIHTSICPECKKVYVSGGVTSTQMTPKLTGNEKTLDNKGGAMV